MINNTDFFNLPAEKYWDFPKSYKGDKKQDITNFIFSGDYIGALKKDGHYYRFVKDGELSLQGRSESVKGGYLNKIDWLPYIKKTLDKLPEGTVLLGEVYFHGGTSSDVTKIMGCKVEKAWKRLEETKPFYYVFDVWAYNGTSLLNTTVEERISVLQNKIAPILSENSHIEIAQYVSGKDLWDLLTWARENDEEGIVMTRKGTIPSPGKRTAKKTVKVKKELENYIDVFLTGDYKPAKRLYEGIEIESWEYWENLRTGEKLNGSYAEDYFDGIPIEPVTKGYFYGYAGSIEIGCMRGDEVFSVGYLSGVSDKIKEEIAKPETHNDYVKLPCKVTAMQFTDDGKLRHPKLVEFREDISYRDCTYDKIYGEE